MFQASEQRAAPACAFPRIFIHFNDYEANAAYFQPETASPCYLTSTHRFSSSVLSLDTNYPIQTIAPT